MSTQWGKEYNAQLTEGIEGKCKAIGEEGDAYIQTQRKKLKTDALKELTTYSN